MSRDMNTPSRTPRQAGFVALFSVIFFALLASVITVGFIRLTVVEQQQALNNDLTARALAAAEAGVEDAKRAILYYNQLGDGAEKDAFEDMFGSDECNALFSPGSPAVTENVITGGGAVAGGQNLYYTCLTVNLNTPDYLETIGENESIVIPLRSNGSFDSVNLEWHLNSDAVDASGDGPAGSYPFAGGELPSTGEFPDERPAYVRAQLIGVPKNGGFSRADLEERSRTVFLNPAATGGSNFTFQGDNRGFNQDKGSPFPVNCQNGGEVQIGQYACEIRLTLLGGALNATNNDYYLQVTSLYRPTHIRVGLLNGGTARDFQAVQPSIDSTGRAADVFRRVEARTNFPGDNYEMLRYGVSVGDNVCKQFQVTGDPSHYSDPAATFCD